jgi:hypothetical protein
MRPAEKFNKAGNLYPASNLIEWWKERWNDREHSWGNYIYKLLVELGQLKNPMT